MRHFSKTLSTDALRAMLSRMHLRVIVYRSTGPESDVMDWVIAGANEAALSSFPEGSRDVIDRRVIDAIPGAQESPFFDTLARWSKDRVAKDFGTVNYPMLDTDRYTAGEVGQYHVLVDPIDETHTAVFYTLLQVLCPDGNEAHKIEDPRRLQTRLESLRMDLRKIYSRLDQMV